MSHVSALLQSRRLDVDVFLRRLWALDAALVAERFPAFSPFWRRDTERWFRSLAQSPGRLRQWVVRAGRRAGKSITWCKIAVAWAVYGAWSVPGGDIGVVALISVNRAESSSRLRTIATILRVLGIAFEQRADEIELSVRPVLFKTFACTTDAVGFTAILIIGDEVARWESRDSAANPAAEVFGTLMPSLATQPFGFAVLSSSPWGPDDFHAEAFARGNTEHQLVSAATTWQANPTLTEADTHALEPNDRVWSREYGNIPGQTISAALPAEFIARAIRPFDGAAEERTPAIGIGVDDPSSGRRDRWVSMIARIWHARPAEPFITRRRYAHGSGWYEEIVRDKDGQPFPNPEFREMQPVLVIEQIMATAGDYWQGRSAALIVAERAEMYREAGIGLVVADQRESYSLESLYRAQGLEYRSIPWTNANKIEAVARLRRWLQEGSIVLPDNAELRHELTAFQERLTPNGGTTYAAPGNGHDDHVACLLTLGLADIAGLIPASPLTRGREEEWARRLAAYDTII